MRPRHLVPILLGLALPACGPDGDGEPEDAPPPLVEEPDLEHRPIEVFHEVQSGEFFGTIVQDLGIPYADQQALIAAAQPHQDLAAIRVGRVLQFRFDPDSDALLDLAYPLGEDSWVTVRRETPEAPFVAALEDVPYETTTVVLTGEVTSSFWETCTDLDLRPGDIIGLAAIFEYDIDFATEVRAGDQVALWIESLALEGDFKKHGQVLAARYINGGEAHEAIYFEPTDEKPGYFTEEGMSTKKRFLRSPLEFSRVASGFSRNRYHPVLHKNRPHWGTDFSAPTGTPIRALGDGRVTFAGTKGGYGNLVILQHDGSYSTRYGHLSKYGKGIKSGTNVQQGQIIGYVGSTGLATGPHLHFEFRIDGKPVDFMKQDFPNTQPVSRADLPRFETVRDERLAHIDAVLPAPAATDPPAPAE